MTTLHFIRPAWFFALIPWISVCIWLYRQHTNAPIWDDICDRQLLPYILQTKPAKHYYLALNALLISALCMILSLTGPAWSKHIIPSYHTQHAHILLLDLSEEMQATDVSPDSLRRAKFKLHDLLHTHHEGQFGLIAYTDEPFVVAPLTDDGDTIDELLNSLSPTIMPVQGNRLDRALYSAQTLFNNSGLKFGDILILTRHLPAKNSLIAARTLAKSGLFVSILPITQDSVAKFQPLATAGKGMVLTYTPNNSDLNLWLASTKKQQEYQKNQDHAIILWDDQGIWLLIPALLLLLPFFIRGVFQRIIL